MEMMEKREVAEEERRFEERRRQVYIRNVEKGDAPTLHHWNNEYIYTYIHMRC